VAIEALDMAELTSRAQQHLSRMIQEYRAQITVADAWPAAWGYGPWVEQVWVNYLSNAIKYGGEPPHIELGATAQPDGMVRFWIRDHGSGIAPQEQERLFTPFVRLGQVQKRGYGLGLSIVRRIVERLGGQVGVESKGIPGQGSIFSFTLPGIEAHTRSNPER
jgi:signal transduction histidine kinase